MFVINDSLANKKHRIPLQASHTVASDLVLSNDASEKKLTPTQVLKLRSQGKDISLLNPQKSDIWSPHIVETKEQQLQISDGQEIEFLTSSSSRIGRFRFTAQTINKDNQQYRFWIGRNIHNLLMNKALLEKLGYRIPPMKWLSKVHIRFNSIKEKEFFITKMQNETFASPKRWLKNYNENIKDESLELELQDVVVTNVRDKTYNLATGYLRRNIIAGRRVLNATLLVYSLLNIPESVNMFSWKAGRISNSKWLIDIDGNAFLPHYEDYLWIAKKLAKLEREDFIEVVEAAKFPAEVASLVSEKVISRRNDWMEAFKIDTDPLHFNQKVSAGEFLVDGKLTKNEWEGYGARYSFGDPESPLNASEITALVKSKTLSTSIANLISKVNKNIMPSTELVAKIKKKKLENFVDQLVETIKTGKKQKQNLAVWSIPHAGASIIASRDVVAGNYMGAESLIQLVDTMGVSASTGLYLGTEGLPNSFHVSGNIEAAVTRLYSHHRPLKSIKSALNTPFENILIPWLRTQYAESFNELLSWNQNEIEGIESKAKITEMLKIFNEQMAIGDSFVVTDSIGIPFQIKASYGFNKYASAYASFLAKQNVLSRIHFVKTKENQIQIYKDKGSLSTLGFYLGVEAYAPVINLYAEHNIGVAQTEFFTLDLNPKANNNLNLLQKVLALRGLLIKNSTEELRLISKPFIVEHDIESTSFGLNLLHFKWDNQRFSDHIRIQHPKGGPPKKLYLYEKASRFGIDYQSYATKVIESIIRHSTDLDFELTNITSGNPADTVFGNSDLSKWSYSTELIESEKKHSNIQFQRSWRGWDIEREELAKLLKEMKKEYDYEFFSEKGLGSTSKVLLYHLNLNVVFYEDAIDNILNHPSDSVEAIFRENYKFEAITAQEEPFLTAVKRHIKEWARQLKEAQEDCREEYESDDIEDAATCVLSIVNALEERVKFKAILEIAGGEENFLAYARLDGFREDEESGKVPYFANTHGRQDDEFATGPIDHYRNYMGMTNEEFGLGWLLRRIR